MKRSTMRWLAAAAACGFLLGPVESGADPVTLDNLLNLPESFSLQMEHTTRYEYVDEQFRPTRPGEDEIFAVRTLLHGRWSPTERLTFGAELQDSRGYEVGNGAGAPGDDISPLSAGIVNAFELLQAYAEFHGAYEGGGEYFAKLGRVTLDIGSRRLIARHIYRNAINAFTGIDTGWSGPNGHALRAFFVLPVDRRPNDAVSLEDNDVKFDDERFDVRLWGLFYETPVDLLDHEDRLELYIYALDESDSGGRQTRDRELYTPGLRLFRPPAREQFDYSIESALQVGESRVSLAATEDLDHFAHFQHVEFGYTFDAPWSPRVVLAYDYASGDDDPNDGDNNRFDTLFGVNRPDFGPTDIFGAFVRSNLSSPGVFVYTKPRTGVTTMLGFRGHWLASDSDAWPAAGVRDATGSTDTYVGSMLDFRVRWTAVPGNVRFEAGYTRLFTGDFADDAPGAVGEDASHFYVQTTLNL